MEPHTKIKEVCPFCRQEVLDVLWWPSHRSINTKRSAVAKSTTSRSESEGHELLSDKCPNCGKTAAEIQKAWKQGTQERKVDYKKRLEELKQLGFSGKL